MTNKSIQMTTSSSHIYGVIMDNIVKLPNERDEIIKIACHRNLKIIKELKDNLYAFANKYRGKRERFHPYVYPFYLIVLAKIHLINKSIKEAKIDGKDI